MKQKLSIAMMARTMMPTMMPMRTATVIAGWWGGWDGGWDVFVGVDDELDVEPGVEMLEIDVCDLEAGVVIDIAFEALASCGADAEIVDKTLIVSVFVTVHRAISKISFQSSPS